MMPSDALNLAEEALETSKCYLRIYSDERLHKDTWEGSEDQATLDTDKEECEKALTAIRAARDEWGWRPIAEWPVIMRGVMHLGAWVEGHGWITMKAEIYSRGMAENGGWTHFYIEPQLPPPPAREEVGNG